jgi:hypothetical protein
MLGLVAGKPPHDPLAIPDLDLPPPSVKTSGRPQPVISNKPAPPAAADFGGIEIERGGGLSAPPSGAMRAAPHVAIEIGGGDDFDMELERGGAIVSQPPASSGRPIASRAPASMSGRPQTSGLDVAYRRMDPKVVVATGPSSAQKVLARVLPLVMFVGTIAGLVKVAHRPGGLHVLSLMPHAFDASSTAQSGGFAGGALVLAIGLGFVGLTLRPRSYAFVVSAAALVITSLAMVTVTLVSTDEHPGPPDGALLIPYVLPFAVLAIGFGLAGRGRHLFLRGGASRGLALLAALGGGAVVFAAIEISKLASRLP